MLYNKHMSSSDNKQLRSGWGRVFKYLLEYKNDVILLSVLGIISAIANGSIPYIIGSFFDALLESQKTFDGFVATMPLWAVLLATWAIAQIFANTVDWINDRRGRKIGTLVHTGFQARAFNNVLQLPMSFHKENKAGDISDRINRASWLLATLIENVIIQLAPQFLSVVVGVAIAFFIHPVLAFVLVGGVMLYIITLIKIVPPIVKLQAEGQESWGKAYGDAYDTYANVQMVKQSTAEAYEFKKINHKFIDITAQIWIKLGKIWSDINFYQRIIIVLTQAIVFIFSAYFIQQGTLTIGELIALNAYAAFIFGPFVMLGLNWQAIENGIIAVSRTAIIFDTPTEVYTPANAVILKEAKGDVAFKNVTFSYKKNEQQILKNVSFEVVGGEVVALVGETGVGKSTVADLISGYYFADNGVVTIDGNDITKIDLVSLRKNIAVVPQEIVLFNDTVKTNIKYGNQKATETEIKKAAHDAHADIFIEKFSKKYDQIVGERGVKLSVGQKQRVAIARALLRNPRILILDEPTSALDVQTERYIEDSLSELMKGRTTFIIAHRLSTVRRADKILVFEKGKIVEQGKHEDLIKIKNGVYHRLYELHIGLK
jgi:ATP-binding cassette, subfamily B, bacterial